MRINVYGYNEERKKQVRSIEETTKKRGEISGFSSKIDNDDKSRGGTSYTTHNNKYGR